MVDNEAPVITCPSDITNVIATSASGAIVSYTEPVGTDNCSATTVLTAGFASGETFPIGDTVVTYEVTDAASNTAECSFTVTVTGVLPEIVCPADITVNNDAGQCSAVVSFVATDDVGIPASEITYSHVSGSEFPVGTTTVTATATNAVGSSECSFDVTVTDNEAPFLTVTSTPITLWPPNHKYETIDINQLFVSLSENCDNLTINDVYITSVSSDEVENGRGDGNTVDDIVIASDCSSVDLRKERSGNGNGRVYTIYMAVMDANGNSSTASSQVHVPHNKKATAIDDGMAYEVECNVSSSVASRSAATQSIKIDEGTATEFEVKSWPNPSNTYFNLSITTVNSTDKVDIQVMDITGKRVHRDTIDYDQSYRFGERLQSGVYFVKISQGVDIKLVRLIKH